jgi:hypothetical protein
MLIHHAIDTVHAIATLHLILAHAQPGITVHFAAT